MSQSIERIVELALREDEAFNDITSDLTVLDSEEVEFEINSRQDLFFCGRLIVSEVFEQLKKNSKFQNSKINFEVFFKDGDKVKSGSPIVRGFGSSKLIFAGERVLLNFIQHLSGIATHTNHFVSELNNQKIKILDTRKTIPNLRDLQKYAVVSGGGYNHRFNLSDMILIKDNHIASAGSVSNCLSNVRSKNLNLKIEIECENLSQVDEAVGFFPDVIMLDNMTISNIQKAIEIIRTISKKTLIEVSGGVSISNIKDYSNLDINFLSIGGLTNSAKAVDIGLDII